MEVQAYLFFEGRAEEAIAFYQKALGAQLEMKMRFDESPQKDKTPPGMGDKIMHASMKIGDTTVMLSDGMCEESAAYKGFSMALCEINSAEAEKYFNALAEGGKVRMPLTKTFWSPKFGMLEDRFGIGWMIAARE